MQKNLLSPLLLALLAGGMILSACASYAQKPTPTAEPEPVEDVTPVVNATAIVVPVERATLALSTAGVIAEVLVEDGQPVQVGDLLVRLKGTESLQAQVVAARTEQVTAQHALDELYDHTGTARDAALQSISQANETMKEARRQLFYLTIPTEQASLTPIEAVKMTEERLATARKDYEPYKLKPDPNAVADPYKQTENQRRQKALKDVMERAQSDFNIAIRRLEYETQLITAQTQLERALQDYEMYSEGPDPKDVSLAQARLDNAAAQLAAAQAALLDLDLRAPFAGTVSELYVHANEWANPGQPVLLLADLSRLRVETTDLNEIDVARLEPGSPVVVTFDALPGVSIPGKVDRIAPKAAQGSGVNYTVIVELNEIPDRLRWGMTAFVDIEVQE